MMMEGTACAGVRLARLLICFRRTGHAACHSLHMKTRLSYNDFSLTATRASHPHLVTRRSRAFSV